MSLAPQMNYFGWLHNHKLIQKIAQAKGYRNLWVFGGRLHQRLLSHHSGAEVSKQEGTP